MKTVLFATSALVAFAGAAAAEVAVSGDARIGLRYEDQGICIAGLPAADCDDGGWNVVNRARVKFTMTGETDSGLSFGATLRADESVGANNSRSTGTGVVWVKGAYGKLSAGDVDSALENAVGDLPEVGLTGLNFYNEFYYPQSAVYDDEVGYADDAVLLYEYQIGDASIYASFQDAYLGYSTQERGTAWSLGAGYTLGNYTFGIGYEDSEYTYLPGQGFATNDSNTWGISGGTSINGITFKAIYLTTSVDGGVGETFADDVDMRQYGIGAEYKMANGVGLAGFWRRVNYDIGAADEDIDYYGIGASYDLGGGAVIKAGVARVNYDEDSALEDNTVADFGLRLNF